MTKPNQLPAWQALQNHQTEISQKHMRDMFAEDAARFEKFSIATDGILFDYSKNRITEETKSLLLKLAEETNLKASINALFKGEKVNWTERRAASHVALRNRGKEPMFVDGVNVGEQVASVWSKMRQFTEEVRSTKRKGYTGKAIQSVVNVGIGGSGLGAKMAVDALRHYEDGRLKVHFVENIDPNNIQRVLNNCNPATTLFIVTSKTFTTLETMANAQLAKQWIIDGCGAEAAVANHFVAVTTKSEKALEFGLQQDSIFEFWDWVGGRYSLWSAVGLPVALAIGMDNYEQLLEGAHATDLHFRDTPFEKNIPVLMALLSVWYGNFWDAKNHCLAIYDERLHRFIPFLQQLDMESNGKSTDKDGDEVNYATGPIIWGGVGTNAQHAFFQLLHQGKHLVPSDFIATKTRATKYSHNHKILLANFIAQTEALMVGKKHAEAAHSSFPGNQPSNTIILDELTPYALGQLTAMYEHKTFAQGCIWNINPFDQWGVELGKKMADEAMQELSGIKEKTNSDSSTKALLNYLTR